MNNSARVIFLPVIFAALLFSGCAKREVRVAQASAPGMMARSSLEMDRLRVQTADQVVEVKNLEAAVKQVESEVQKTDGRIQSQRMSEEKRAHLVLRVPASQLKPMLDSIARLGTEESRSVSSQDVTEQYIDTEAKLKNAIALRDRLRGLLGQAKEVKDILEIERELSRVQGEIDSMEGRMKALKGKIDLARIHLTLNQKKILGPLGYVFYGIGWLIKKLFILD